MHCQHHDILPIFVNIPAIYLHVFNLTMELTECPEDHICHEDGTKGFSTRSPLTVAQMMARSVLAIGDLACKELKLPEEEKATVYVLSNALGSTVNCCVS